MILGIYGGSFDPPHLCHVFAAHYALAAGEIERVLVAPCFTHPFGKSLAPFHDRIAMCRLAMEALGGRVEVSDIESRRPGPSYTIDTIRALASERPADRFRLIVGSDILDEAPKWRAFDEIRRLAPLIVVPRGPRPNGAATLFSLPDVSSTAIRDALRQGRPAGDALPRNVLDYIFANGLYGASMRPSAP
ncbi:MAG: Nicotinate-nucleotide adenylyltransferase [candidate division BRC1 bacterium ADurb.BinA364]|nr:MAG: Nicotinate-nucleotide adenylyltransferase [candidate division BRC1 bacterium ADurb.BinA364]